MNNEQRKFSRILCDGTARIIMADGGSWDIGLQDLSLKGALTDRPENFNASIGDSSQIKIVLEGSETPIVMQATIAHTEQGRVGFCCQYIDLDSIASLRRLVELNLANETLLERELVALGQSVSA